MPTSEPSTLPPPPSRPDDARAWSPTELADPHSQGDKPERVRRMFGAIARRYDLNNRLHSLWRDQAWRRFAVRQAALAPADIVLDVACGTGDLTEAMARGVDGEGAARVTGLDFTPQMLDIARHKQSRLPPDLRARVDYVQGDAMALPLPDASVDVVSIAFGIRNVADPARAIAEFRRVLRPGGRLVILEFGTPRLAPVRWFNDFYCRHIMPITATLISGDRSGAYRYLPRSIATFLSKDQMLDLLERSGFRAVTATDLSLGICTFYRGIAGTRGGANGPG